MGDYSMVKQSSKYQFQTQLVDNKFKEIVDARKRKEQYRKLVVSPTGSGKSFMMMRLKELVDARYGKNSAAIIVPTPELFPDFLEKAGVEVLPDNKEKVRSIAVTHSIYSNIWLLNELRRGTLDAREFAQQVKVLIVDEAHHDEAETYQRIYSMLDDTVCRIGFTATPFCGTPQATYKFREKWQGIDYAITLPDALQNEVISFPNIEVIPLVNDDILTVKGNEFVIEQVEAAYEDKMEHAIAECVSRGWWNPDGTSAVPTCIGVPSSRAFGKLTANCAKFGIKLATVSQDTPAPERKRIYAGVKDCQLTIAHINVISEGKDLPIRNYLDLRPSMSPRLFFQIFGRTTRPLKKGEKRGTYLCTNRNIERHCYLFENTVPYSQISKAILAFPERSVRATARAFGIESLGRIKPTEVLLKSGLPVNIYNVTQMKGSKKERFICLLHPLIPEPVWFREIQIKASFGAAKRLVRVSFEMITPPTELKGYKSSPPFPLTEKQLKMWNDNAEKYGIHPDQKVDAKKFTLLPALIHSGLVLI
jgi:superfamily II DNA or RNA helicase